MRQTLCWEHEVEHDMTSALNKLLNQTRDWPFQEGFLEEVAPKMNLAGKIGVGGGKGDQASKCLSGRECSNC